MIRLYEAQDLDDVLEVWYQASLIAHSFLTENFFEQEREEISRRWMKVAETHVHEEEGHVVGFIALIGNEVGALFVHPTFQRRGIGKALMDHARAWRPYLELDVFEANLIGRGFYDAYGFRLIDRHMNEMVGLPELRLRLDADT